ncbi:lysyl oxidase-like 1 [Musca autumnalis]|uniref:lysyl oxidase-like 1 n=1 Tax=Musca autumnalis TaxID=221902 RepID=UPI003CEDAFEF
MRQPQRLETNFRNMRVRLNNAVDNPKPLPNIREGRVEISTDFGRSWGTVCATHWSFREANVVCRQLNLGYAVATNQTTQFGNSTTHPWGIVGTLCRGSEKLLRDCYRESTYPKICNASNPNVAVVKCIAKISDLKLGLEEIQRHAYLDTQPLAKLKCAMEENCLSRDAYELVRTQPGALRKLLRFETKAENVGSADFSPYANYDQWQWHQCHLHYHSMEAFASFDIYDFSYRKMAQGHKASFCLMDTSCRPGVRRKYTCGNRDQGISVGCADTYNARLDCQWVDVTNLPPHRTYILRVAINPNYAIGEESFENNGAECLLDYTGERITTRLRNCTQTPLWYAK